MPPQDGVGGRTPTPKKDNVASSNTVVAIPRVPQTRMVGHKCGRMWTNKILGHDAPIERMASMYSLVARAMVWL